MSIATIMLLKIFQKDGKEEDPDAYSTILLNKKNLMLGSIQKNAALKLSRLGMKADLKEITLNVENADQKIPHAVPK